MTHLGYCGTKNSFFRYHMAFYASENRLLPCQARVVWCFRKYIYISSVDSVNQMVYENMTRFPTEQSLCPIWWRHLTFLLGNIGTSQCNGPIHMLKVNIERTRRVAPAHVRYIGCSSGPMWLQRRLSIFCISIFIHIYLRFNQHYVSARRNPAQQQRGTCA